MTPAASTVAPGGAGSQTRPSRAAAARGSFAPGVVLLLAAALCCAAIVLLRAVPDHHRGPGGSPAFAERARGARVGVALPASLQLLASRVIGASDRELWVHRHGEDLSASGGGLISTFSASRVTVRAGSAALSLRLLGIGHGGRLQPVAVAAPTGSGDSVLYRRGGVLEWYRNGAYGLEQGFTLALRPNGAGELHVALAIGGSLRARAAGSNVLFSTPRGIAVLSYGNLSVRDAAGRELPARLTLARGELDLQIDDRAARYPLRIDPFIQQGSKLVPNDERTPGGAFGFSVAISADGSTALVGAPDDAEELGAAWVFTRSGSTWSQQGPPLIASDESGRGAFGYSVALSEDGDTALIGGPEEGGSGAAWVFTRSGSTWSQQGPKLTGAEEAGGAFFGQSVALSADGDTAIVSGPGEDGLIGAAWVFTRSGSTWSQQGGQLRASDEAARAQFGISVALSADGDTALIGGPGETAGSVDGVGAAWVFTRSGSTWSQQAKLVGEGEDVPGLFGWSVALSAGGNTALVGGPKDDDGVGAAWVFTRSGSTWTEQGPKLLASGEGGQGEFAYSVALSADGDTALIGGPYEGSFLGAAWVFTRSGSTWSQQGAKLTGAGEVGGGYFGESVALSGDGDTAFVGGSYDNDFVGAAWAFTRSGSIWSQQGPKLTGSGETGVDNSFFGASAAISANGDTALIGGPLDNEGHGAAWVFTRSGSTWSQQAKLVGSTQTGPSGFGSAVALSANGDTALVGGPHNANGIGAAWVFIRSGSTWSRQGPKLTASPASGFIEFGSSLALSGSGDTAMIGGPGHDAASGAAWVFTRSGSSWSQQAKLTGRGESGRSEFGESVALSSNGKTALIGGPGDDGSVGAAWVFTRSGSSWSQQGAKLRAHGESGAGGFGDGVALSSNGKTALIGGPGDDGSVGAAWVFARSGSSWAQQAKLTGAGELGEALFGHSVALAGKGELAVIGGWGDDASDGAAWAFARSGSSWSQLGPKLLPDDESGAGAFGDSLALSESGEAAVIGGPADGGNVGAAWPFVDPSA